MTSNTDFLLGIRAAMKFQESLLKQLFETIGGKCHHISPQ